MGVSVRLWNWLTTPGVESPQKGHPDLYPLDVGKLARELRLVEEARRLGEAGLPAPDATAISGPEAAVVQRVEKARQDYVDWAAYRYNVLSQDLGRRNITQDVNRALRADEEFDRKAGTVLAGQESILRSLGESARASRAELDAFRARHRLAREARVPSGTRSYLQYALLILLVAVEGVLNARFFAQGLDTGLLGGFIEAMVMAALNVCVAFLLGKFAIRYVCHRQALPKMAGFAALVFAFAAMVCIALGIAHYRDSLAADIANPAQAALDAFTTGPLHLRDVFSWALFVISLAFGVVSLFDGLFSDDLYPGYGAVSRRALQAADDFEEELVVLREELDGLKNEELAMLDKTLERSQADLAVFGALVKDKQTTGSRLSTALRDADHSLDALLRQFRTENELHRNGAPRPVYFDGHPDLRPIQPPDFGGAADQAALCAQQDLVNTLLAQAQAVKTRVQAVLDRHMARLGGPAVRPPFGEAS